MKSLLGLLALLVSIQGGTFKPFYSPGKVKTAEVRSFELMQTPVTNRQYLEFVRAHPQWRRSRVLRIYADHRYLQHWKDDLSYDPALADSPVTFVSWFAARAFLQEQKLRLPTLLEWEYAARTSDTKVILDWYSRPNSERLPPVGSGWKAPNGVRDLHGLVWEWVDDYNSVLFSPESRTGPGVDGSLFCAAGALGSADPSDYAAFMRYGFRSSLKAKFCLANLGFRGARTPPTKGKL